jgi:2-hydroxy-3-oxopropionate reductase
LSHIGLVSIGANMPERIGFIGLGIMGKPMARNLLQAAYALTVFNRSRPAVDELAAAGARPAASSREVAEQSDVVITMLPDSPDVEGVVMGENGVLAGAKAGLLLIDMSTISPLVARRLAAEAQQRGVYMLDAPVSGGEEGAIAGTLSIMAGGETANFTRARPIFDVLGTTVTHCGPSGTGQTVKACNQVAVALIIAAVSEALVLGSKAGVAPEIILQVLGGGLAQNRVMELRGPNMIRHRFDPGGKAGFHHKDLGIVLELARTSGVSLPVTAVVDQLFAALIAAGKGDWDHSALMTVIEALSGATS